MRDLEIRGAGNLLGDDQSGHVAAVGFELYVGMLDEAVASLAGDSADEAAEPVRVDLPVDAYVPGDYVPYEAAKIEVHRRVAGAKEVATLIMLREELQDRFGPVPEPLDNLIRIQDARIKLGRAGARSVDFAGGRLAVAPIDLDSRRVTLLRERLPEAVYESGPQHGARARTRRAYGPFSRRGGCCRGHSGSRQLVGAAAPGGLATMRPRRAGARAVDLRSRSSAGARHSRLRNAFIHMTSSFTFVRLLAAVALAGACAAVVAGCGNSLPASAVAKVDDSTITKEEFERWLTNAAAGQSQGGEASIPKPPEYTECIATLKKQPQAQGATKQSDAQLKKQCQQQYEGLRDEVMQFLIQAEWVQQEAEERGVEVSDAEVKKSFEDQKKQAFPKAADYDKFLKESGMGEEDILFRVKLDQLQTKLTKKITEDKVKVSDEDIAAHYEKNKKQFAVPEARDVNLVLTKTKAKADEAKSRIEDGDEFEAVAKDLSIDEATKSQGGKLTGLTKGQQDPELEKAAFAAKRSELEGPVKTQFGYYVFEVSKVTEATQPELAEVKDRISQQLRSEKEQKVLNDFIKEFREEYKEKTECADDFRIAECSNAPKKEKTDQAPATGGAPGGAAPQQGAPPGAVPGAPPQGGAAPAPQQVPPGAGGAPPQQVPPGAGGAPPPQVPPPASP